jgi:peptide/nickel transport system permease protein
MAVPSLGTQAAQVAMGDSRIAAFRRSVRRRRAAYRSLVLGLGFIVTMLLAAYFLPLKYGPYETLEGALLEPPSREHPFGTDTIGRDVFARVVTGGQLDLPLALTGVVVALMIGVPLGLVASARGRVADALMRVLDMLQAFPLIILVIVLVAVTGGASYNIIIAIALFGAPQTIRLVRGAALTIRESRFADAAIAMGSTGGELLRRHILPNVVPNILAQASLNAANAIFAIAALSFLGVGIRPPTATWGGMVREGLSAAQGGLWWESTFASLAIVLSVISFNLIAEGVESLLGEA